MDQRGADGNTVYQWLGDGKSAYPLAGLPYMDIENICAMFDITEKKRDKLYMRQMDAPEDINLNDTDVMEGQLEDPKLCVRYDGRDILPLETSEGIAFIQEKYLAPLDNTEYRRLYERRSPDGRLYIVAKIGMIVQAIIMPMNLPDEGFMELLDGLTRQCRAAILNKGGEQAGQEQAALYPGQSTLFRVDESTGEIIGEGAGAIEG